MKIKLFAVAAFAVALVTVSQAVAEDKKTIADVVAGSKDHTILLTALREAGLVDTLNGKGPFTVFAPTDAAFKKLGEEKIKAVVADKELLKKILLAHVVVEKAVFAKDVAGLDGKEVNGFMISTKDGVKIGEAKVTTADIKCSNGVIHVIDTVLVPAK
jgi:uncharacterized surface protein with fasciclin (FAS1) repeats